MAGNNNTKNDSTQKIVTKYDKKMAKRKAEQRKQERESFIFKVVGIGVLAGIVLALVITLGTRYSIFLKMHCYHRHFTEIRQWQTISLIWDIKALRMISHRLIHRQVEPGMLILRIMQLIQLRKLRHY